MSMWKRITITIPGEAKAFARAGRGGTITFTPKPQRDYMALVKHEAALRMAGALLFDGPVSLTLEVTYEIPRSWSQKKKAAAVWKDSAPDIDNLVKLVKDSLQGIVYHNDAQVACIHGGKVYGEKPRSVITISQL